MMKDYGAETFAFKLLFTVLRTYMLKIIRSLWSDVCTLLIDMFVSYMSPW